MATIILISLVAVSYINPSETVKVGAISAVLPYITIEQTNHKAKEQALLVICYTIQCSTDDNNNFKKKLEEVYKLFSRLSKLLDNYKRENCAVINMCVRIYSLLYSLGSLRARISQSDAQDLCLKTVKATQHHIPKNSKYLDDSQCSLMRHAATLLPSLCLRKEFNLENYVMDNTIDGLLYYMKIHNISPERVQLNLLSFLVQLVTVSRSDNVKHAVETEHGKKFIHLIMQFVEIGHPQLAPPASFLFTLIGTKLLRRSS